MADTVVIVGGGISGLSAGVFLSRRGIQVKLFEANDKPGGCCATTNIDGYIFNDGALYLVLPRLLDFAFKRLGLDRPASVPLRRISAVQNTILPDGSVVNIDDELSVTIDSRNGTNSRLYDELGRLKRKWRPVLDLFTSEIFTHPLSYQRLVTKGWRHLHKFRGTVASELNALISDEAVRAALSGALLYSGVPPEKMPISLMLALVALFCDGCFLPEGGMGKIAVALRQAFETSGGELLLNSKVNKIALRDDTVQGVEVEAYGFVEADAVISSVSGLATFGLLMQSEAVPKQMKRKVQTAHLSHKPVSLQLGLSNRIDVPSYFNCVLPMMEKQYQVFMPDEPEAMWPVYAVPTMVLPDLAPSGGSIIEMYPTVRQDKRVDDWNEQEKEKITEAAIEALSRMHTLDIVAKRVRSPKDFRDSLHLYKGAVYGLSATTDPRALFPHTPPIRGLYLAGQTTYPGIGVSSSAMSGIFAAEAVMRAREL